MHYRYLIEDQIDRDVTVHTLLDNNTNTLNILCYHVNTESKYPFIQFMLEKIPFCGELLREQFILPSYMFSNFYTNDNTIEHFVINKVKKSLAFINCNYEKVNLSMYKGIYYDKKNKPYALVNISDIDINYIALNRNSNIWFALPSEILNTRDICNIEISEDIYNLFSENPMLSLLHYNNVSNYKDMTMLDNVKPLSIYPVPDVVYTGGEYKDVQFCSIFGVKRREIYKNMGENYYFFRNFNNAVKEGGWCLDGGIEIIDLENKNITHNKVGKLIIDNEYGRFIKGGINRYAIFIENPSIVFDDNDDNDDKNEDNLNENGEKKCSIILKQDTSNKILPDILVKDYNMFFPLTFHELDKKYLDYKYIEENKHEYCIL